LYFVACYSDALLNDTEEHHGDDDTTLLKQPESAASIASATEQESLELQIADLQRYTALLCISYS